MGRQVGDSWQEVWGPVLAFGNIYFKVPVAIGCTEARQSSPVSYNTEASEDRASGYVDYIT